MTLLLVLTIIENNVELDCIGAEGKYKMESMDSCIPKKPKKVGWTGKNYVHFKKHGGQFKSHNTHDCCCFNKDGTLTKGHGGTGRPKKERKRKGMSTDCVCGLLKSML